MMRAAVVDERKPGHVTIREVAAPTPTPGEALVRVTASSLTPSEVDYSQSKGPEKLLGCDVAGIIAQQAADGSGPKTGARVIGRVRTGAWAELVAVPTDALAVLPENISFEQGATLPTSGLTALYVLETGGHLLGYNVLITAANGSVGQFACRLAKLMQARVIGQVRREKHIELVTRAGADQVVVDDSAGAAAEFGPYRLIADAVGGPALGNCINMLEMGGVCVVYANLSQADTTLNAESYLEQSRACIYSFVIHQEFFRKPAANGLARLAQLVYAGKVDIPAYMTENIDRIDLLVQQFTEHRVEAKPVIRMWS